MSFRQSGQADHRRRRVLLEEKRAAGAGGAEAVRTRQADGNSARHQRTYSEAALASNQPPVTVLIPQRAYTLAVVLLATLCGVAAGLAAYCHVYLTAHAAWLRELACLDLALPGNAASWFASLLLLAAAFQAGQIYRLRRHRTDDYRGRYRVWIAMPIVLSVMALHAATPLLREAAVLAGRLGGLVPGRELQYLQMAAFCACWTLISLRLTFEVQRCWLAVVLLVLSVACYFAAMTLQTRTWPATAEPLRVLATATALLTGHWAVLSAVTAYARHVYLDAQGLLGVRAVSRRRSKTRVSRGALPEQKVAGEAAAQSPAAMAEKAVDQPQKEGISLWNAGSKRPVDEKTRADMPRVTTPTISAAHDKAAAVGRTDADDGDSDEDGESAANEYGDGDRELSRAERRRLRKLQRREQRRAA
jgi:hypothetical protein